MAKFDKVPVEADTKIIFQQEAKLGEYNILYQKWIWGGIAAESIIFSNQDISEVDEEKIIFEVKSSPLVNQDSEITFNRSDSGYTFVSFNFDDD